MSAYEGSKMQEEDERRPKKDPPSMRLGAIPEKTSTTSKITTLAGVIEWIDKDIAEHDKTFGNNKPPFVKGAMTALKNLKHFIETPTKEPAGEKPMRSAPVTVRITQCTGYAQSWYKNAIGHEFGVDNAGSQYDYVVWEDMMRGNGASWRHIKKVDCEVVKRADQPTPDPGHLGETPGDVLRKAVDFALSIRDLWATGQVGTVSADHEGEVQALSKMEEMFKQATLLTPAFTGEKPGPLGRREDVPQEILREELAQAQFERNVAQVALSSANARIADLEKKCQELQEWHDSHI